jgi:hypothetical protein
MRPQGLKPAPILKLYAALKRRSSAVLPAFVSFSATSGSRALPEIIYEATFSRNT